MWELENLSWSKEEWNKYWRRQQAIVVNYGNVINRRIDEASTLEQVSNLFILSQRSFNNALKEIRGIRQPTMVSGSNTRH